MVRKLKILTQVVKIFLHLTDPTPWNLTKKIFQTVWEFIFSKFLTPWTVLENKYFQILVDKRAFLPFSRTVTKIFVYFPWNSKFWNVEILKIGKVSNLYPKNGKKTQNERVESLDKSCDHQNIAKKFFINSSLFLIKSFASSFESLLSVLSWWMWMNIKLFRVYWLYWWLHAGFQSF